MVLDHSQTFMKYPMVIFEGIQHTHNIFLELTFNHGLLVAFLIVFTMINILISASTKNHLINEKQGLSFIDRAWIISFANFLLIHMFDITYFDGRISILSWTLISRLEIQ